MSNALRDTYLLQQVLASTWCAEAYRAVDRVRGSSSLVWILRSDGGIDPQPCLERLEQFGTVVPPIVSLLTCGRDGSGVVFAVLPSVDGQPIDAGRLEGAEAERRFIWAIRLIDRVHSVGISLGDLCPASFLVDRGGEVRFISVLGAPRGDLSGLLTRLSPDLAPFLAPELLRGSPVTPATDVYSLGVLGTLLLTGTARGYQDQLVFDARKQGVPAWAAAVLDQMRAEDPVQRPADARAVLALVNDIRTRGVQPSNAPARGSAGRAVVPAVRQTAVVPAPAQQTTNLPGPVVTPASRVPAISNRTLLLSSVGALALSGIVGLSVLSPGSSDSPAEAGLAGHAAAVANPELQQALHVIGNEALSLATQEIEVEKFVGSDDPLAHQILVTMARDATSVESRKLAEQGIIERARRLGLLRSAEQVRQWLRTISSERPPPVYETILSVVNAQLPTDVVAGLVRQVYAVQPLLALRLAVALSFDLGRGTEMQPLVAALLADYKRLASTPPQAVVSLVLAHQELSLIYGDDALQQREQIPSSDLLWVIEEVGARGDAAVRPLVSLALERSLVAPIPSELLVIVRDRSNLEREVVRSLVRGAAARATLEDVAVFGRWYDVSSERVLYALASSSSDPSLSQAIFDTLAAKSLADPIAAPMVDLVRREYWDQRATFVPTLGTLAMSKLAPDDLVATALAALAPFAKDRRILTLLAQAEDPRVVQGAVDRFNTQFGLAGLIAILSHQDVGVRKTVVRSLAGYNDVTALKIIIDAFEAEKDEGVRDVYRETFWVIREREGKKR